MQNNEPSGQKRHTRRKTGSQSQGTKRVSPAASVDSSHEDHQGERRTAHRQVGKGHKMLARIRNDQEEHEGGFTLIELLVVIIIIGILAAIAIPVFLNQRNKGYDAQAKSDLRNAATVQETYLVDNDVYGTLAQISAVGTYDFATSANVQSFLVGYGAGATDGYCMNAESDSGNWFQLDSRVSSGVTGPTAAVVACP